VEKARGVIMVNSLKWTTVTREEVEAQNYRLEATVFKPEAKKAMENLLRCKFPILRITGKNGIATAYHRLRFRRVFVPKSKFPIYQPSQILDTYPKPELFISSNTKTDIDALRVTKGQILMTCSGTIGKCTVVSNTLNNQIFSHDLLRITAKDGIDTGYIYAFFKTEVGQLLLSTNNYGAVISHIEPDHLDHVQIPYADKTIRSLINDAILKSFEFRDRSNDLMKEAENLLIGELKLPEVPKIKPEYFSGGGIKTFSVPLNAINDRLDPSYHVPVAGAIIDYLLDNAEKVISLGNSIICEGIVHPERFKRVYVNDGDGVTFFGGKGLLSIDPAGKKSISASKHAKQITGLILKENMILVTRSGTIGKVNIVPKHWHGWIATDDLIRLIIKNPESMSGYIYVWLQSDYGKILLKRLVYGSVVDHIEVEHIAQVPVPFLKNSSLMEKINKLALEANNLRTEAYKLEQQAIDQMNKEVIYA
jgi:type I restriction enzyme, S subunit